MNFRTPVAINPKNFPVIDHSHSLMSLGSCFSEHMRNKLVESKFNCLINPYGVMYNPLSVAKALREVIEQKQYHSSDLFEYNEKWHSWMHHGSFSSTHQEQVLEKINSQLEVAQCELPTLDYLLVTWGSAWVYKRVDTEEVVSNCHKVAGNEFSRVRIGVGEIVKEYENLLKDLWMISPRLKVIMSLSPIRHIRDGMHANQLSKATLLLAIDELQKLFPTQVVYFPSYEIVLDELRDYRFYAEDMVHPSPLAIEYIWHRFEETFFEDKTIETVQVCEQINKSLQHRPTDSNTAAYRSFLQHLVEKMEQISIKNPKLDFRKEINQCLTQLKK